MSGYAEVIHDVREFIENFFKEKVPAKFAYHNFDHTHKVVEASKLIAENNGMSKSDVELVQLAAWFHDVGHYQGRENHEAAGIKLMKETLPEKGVADKDIEIIAGCIEATKMSVEPQTELQKVLIDADMYHLSTPYYFSEWELMKKEHELLSGESVNDFEWLEENIDFFKSHKYHSPYGKEVLEKLKKSNFDTIKKRMKEIKKKDKTIVELKEKLEKLKAKSANDLKPDKARETMLRITSRNHLELSVMADNKANIMISINAIILSIVVSVLIRKLEESPYLIIPTLILTVVCLVTIVFSILATRPNVSKGKFTNEDVLKKKANLLFFGNFHGVPLETYMWGMTEMLKDSEYLYGSMIKDIYNLGVILGKKYRRLRIAYNIFMFGFVIAVLAFVFGYTFREGI